MNILFSGKQYAISEILEDEEDCHQYRIFIKDSMMLKPEFRNSGMDRAYYTDWDDGIERVHWDAKDIIAKYFIPSVRVADPSIKRLTKNPR